jgi:prepilin-type N-terminal cleavage/methylation domain-containing protein
MRPAAFTLLETIVCILILSILGSLTLVGINYARETARRTECMNRQRNVVIAVQNHLSQQQRYPNLLNIENGSDVFGPVFELLPLLEQGAVVDQIKSSQASQVSILRQEFYAEWMQCPSDFVEKRINLRFCLGSLPPGGRATYGGFFNNGIFGLGRAGKSSDLTRGTDTTIAVSERIACNRSNKRLESFDVFGAFRFNLQQLFNVETIRRLQGEQPDHVEEVVGREALSVSYQHTLFNTMDPPNGKIRDVWIADVAASITARSRHSSGVNVGFASGAVRFVSDSIDPKVWNDYGIANGN